MFNQNHTSYDKLYVAIKAIAFNGANPFWIFITSGPNDGTGSNINYLG